MDKKQQRTTEELEELKRQWRNDPCWDIEDSDGFEAHKEELMIWRKAYEKTQEIAELMRVSEKAHNLGIPFAQEAVKYIEMLEYRIARLEKLINDKE